MSGLNIPRRRRPRVAPGFPPPSGQSDRLAVGARWLALALVLCLGAAATGFGPPSLVESSGADDPLFAYQVPLARRIASPPEVGARGAVVLDDASGQSLLSRDAQRRLPIASTTKI